MGSKDPSMLVKAFLDAGAGANMWVSGRNVYPLHIAKDRATMQVLLDAGADLTLLSATGLTALHAHCRSDEPERVQLLLDHGADIRARTPDGNTPLLVASRCGNLRVVDALLHAPEAGALVNDVASDGRTALMDIALNRVLISDDMEYAMQCIRLLLEKKADVNVSDNIGRTALMYACNCACEPLVSLLLEHKADASCMSTSGETALLLACMSPVPQSIPTDNAVHADSHGVVSSLLKAPGATALINHSSTGGYTALSRAIFNSIFDVVPALIRGGASILHAHSSLATADAPITHLLWTALKLTAESRRCDVLRLLLERVSAEPELGVAREGALMHGDDVLVSAVAFTTFMCTVLSDNNKDVNVAETVSAFIAAGVDCNIVSDHGCPPLYLACIGDELETAKLLLNAGADPAVCCITQHRDGMAAGSTALMVALDKSIELFDLILSRLTAEQVNAVNSASGTALHLAVKCSPYRPHLINSLLSAGALIDARTASGYTPLLLACGLPHSSRQPDAVQLLLSHRADLHATGMDGITVLMASIRTCCDGPRWASEWGFLLRDPAATTAWINARASDGKTALAMAMRMASTECVELLLDAKADIGDVSHGDFYSAADSDADDRLMQLLMTRDVDVSAFWEFKHSELISAIAHRDYDDLHKFLAAPIPPNINHKDSYTGQTLLFNIRHIPSEILRDLFAAGADPSIADNEGAIPINRLLTYGLSSFKLIFEMFPQAVNYTDASGRSVFMRQCMQPSCDDDGLQELYKYLSYVDPSITDVNGDSVLHAAMNGRRVTAVRSLLAHSDVFSVGYEGSTVLMKLFMTPMTFEEDPRTFFLRNRREYPDVDEDEDEGEEDEMDIIQCLDALINHILGIPPDVEGEVTHKTVHGTRKFADAGDSDDDGASERSVKRRRV
jgi:ankyrin repeat protein